MNLETFIKVDVELSFCISVVDSWAAAASQRLDWVISSMDFVR
jgi:hypothetical protein